MEQPEREGSDSETIIPDSNGTVTHSSGMTVDTHYAAQLRPSRLSGSALTFIVRHIHLSSSSLKED
jgi:hypothetical protein